MTILPCTGSPQYHFNYIPSTRNPQSSHTTGSSNTTTVHPEQTTSIYTSGKQQGEMQGHTSKENTAPCTIDSQQSKKKRHRPDRERDTQLRSGVSDMEGHPSTTKELGNTNTCDTNSQHQDKPSCVDICLTRCYTNGFVESEIQLSEDNTTSKASQNSASYTSISNRPPFPLPASCQDSASLQVHGQDSASLQVPSLEDSISPTPITAIREHSTLIRWQRILKAGRKLPLETSGNYVNEGMGPLNV